MESPPAESHDHLSSGEKNLTDPSESNGPEEKRRIFFETRSLAEVYARQGHVSVALEIYRRIQRRNPSDHQVEQKISELEGRLRSRRPGKSKDQNE